MALCEPEQKPAVKAAAIEFLKLCHKHGLRPEQILQAGIVVMASAIAEEAREDLDYRLELVDRLVDPLKSAVRILDKR